MSRLLSGAALGSWVDPEAVFVQVFADLPHVFWLDAGPGATAGWSWMGAGSPEPNHGLVRGVEVQGPGADGVGAPDAHDGDTTTGFAGGWVGWVGYENGATRAEAPVAPPAADDLPSEVWIRAERWVAFDHTSRSVTVFAQPDEVAGLVVQIDGCRGPAEPPPPPSPATAVARHSAAEYARLIEACRAEIRDGNAYQLCLTTRFSVAAAIDPVAAYRRLRAETPAHHGGFIRSGGHALLSASPERFLESRLGIVRTRPIKGTRPRGATTEGDAGLADDLRDSVKERAENVMIVDLMRNDLSRVCDPGTVGVDALLAVESYPAVHQLVSTVSGRLRAGTTLDDLLHAAFPAGSMTGAPKLSAMTILRRLEGGPRGVFAGCFGWVGADGACDLAMVIRSIMTDGSTAHVGAGGGITWRSEAADEVAEVGVKARAPLAAIGASLPAGW